MFHVKHPRHAHPLVFTVNNSTVSTSGQAWVLVFSAAAHAGSESVATPELRDSRSTAMFHVKHRQLSEILNETGVRL